MWYVKKYTYFLFISNQFFYSYYFHFLIFLITSFFLFFLFSYFFFRFISDPFQIKWKRRGRELTSTYFTYAKWKVMKQVLLFRKKHRVRLASFSCHLHLKRPRKKTFFLHYDIRVKILYATFTCYYTKTIPDSYA